MFGVTGPKLLWITAWISLSRYDYCGSYNTLLVFEYLHQIALFVIGVAGSSWHSPSNRCSHVIALGFGRRVTWTTDLVVPPGHRMAFKDALHISSTNLLVKLALPDWAKYLTKHTRLIWHSRN